MEMRKFLFIAIAGLMMMTNGCAASRLGDKSISETFADERVASVVTAVSDGNYSAADKLIKAGADINAIGVDGISPLLWIMSTTLDVRKIGYMLKAGANPNYRDPDSQASAMFLGAGGNRPDILELLLKNKGDPNLFGPRDQNLLMTAVSQGRDKNIDLLLKYGADINLTDHHRETVANKAAGYGRFDWVAHFLNIGLTHDLQDLAKDVEIRQVPANSEQQHWKDKVIAMLKVRGVKFPAFIPCYPPDDPRRKSEDCK